MATGAVAAAVLVAAVVVATLQEHSAAGGTQVPGRAGATGTRTDLPLSAGAGPPVGPLPRQLFVPDLIAAEPAGLSSAQLTRIGKLPGVRETLTLDGGQVRVNGAPATVIGADPRALRAWTPPRTAADVAAWASLGQGGLVATAASHASGAPVLGGKPVPGGKLPADGKAVVTGRTTARLPARATHDLGIPGVDAVVNQQRSAQLGLAHGVAVLINAPGADLHALIAKVRGLLGPHGQVRNLVPVVVYRDLPVTVVPVSGVPDSYLQLYQESATRYCPGLSWTVLAAIGEIESGHGANDGPSSAGALGPMQFLPSTWAIYGINGFNRTGNPDIMNPLDAVPSAARMLCADGATAGQAGLRAAIFAYNHATWYGNEVLDLAAEYASAYR